MGTIDDLMSARAVILPDVVGWLLTYAVHSSLLLGLAWLCTRYVRPYRLKEILWKTALVGGLLTATLQVTLGINPLTGRFDLLSNASTGLARQIPTFQVTLAPSGAGATDPTQDYLWALNSVPGANADGQITGSANQASPLPWNSLADALQIGVRWLLGLWLIGVTVALLRLGHISRRLRATLRDRRDIREGPLADILARLCQAAGVRKYVRLTCSSRISRPMTLNAREICLPWRVTRLNAGQQESLLAHELAHVIRRDPLWLMASHVLESLFFFQPLHHLARRRIQECAEYLADDQAARYTGSGLTLATCLVEVAGWPSYHAFPAIVAGMAESMSSLERRVRRLLDSTASRIETPRWWWAVIAISILAVVVSAGPGVTVSASGAPPAITGQDSSPWQVIRLLEFDWPVALAGFSDDQSGILIEQSGQFDGLALRATDGGQTWNVQENQCESPGDPGCECQSSSVTYCLGLDVVDEQVAWRCGYGSHACVTTNGGQNWQSNAEDDGTYYKYDRCRFLSFLDAEIGWSAIPNQLLATEDGGATWAEIALPEGRQRITTVARRTVVDGYVLDDIGTLFVTHDAGETWAAYSLGLDDGEQLLNQCGPTTTMRFFDADHGIVVFSSVAKGQTGLTWIARTADGGQTWQREQLPPIPQIKGSVYYHHLAHDGKTLTVTGLDGKQVAVLRYREP